MRPQGPRRMVGRRFHSAGGENRAPAVVAAGGEALTP